MEQELASALRIGQLGVVYLPSQGYGSLVFAGDYASLDHVRFAHRYGSGIMIVSLSSERLRQLNLQPFPSHHTRSPAFTASVDAANGTTTGISASDRLATIRALSDPQTSPDDFARPGHVFPIQYNDQWDAHAADVASYLASRENFRDGRQAGVATAIMNDAGNILDLEATARFSKRHRLPFWVVPDLSGAAAPPNTTTVVQDVRSLVTIPYGY